MIDGSAGEDRTYDFALRVIRMVRALPEDYGVQAIGRQVLRSGTGIGANVEEAIGGASLKDSQWMPAKLIEPLIQEALELAKILSKIVSTTRKNLAQTAR